MIKPKSSMIIFQIKENTSGVIVNIYDIPPNHNAYLYNCMSKREIEAELANRHIRLAIPRKNLNRAIF